MYFKLPLLESYREVSPY